jgi:hypothetical protein
MRPRHFALLTLIAAAGCRSHPPAGGRDLDVVAEDYVKLVLAFGQHDPATVDAFYGPEDWKTAAALSKRPIPDLRREGAELRQELDDVPARENDDLTRARRRMLGRQLDALLCRMDLVSGAKMTFDEESQALYDAVAPRIQEADLRAVHARLEQLLPGQGSLGQRYENLREAFFVPRERLDHAFRTAIVACRDRTRARVTLPAEESFTVEYVTGQPWSAYNWYQGGYRSLIQVNTDLPTTIDRVIDLAAHEGYPGHHVYNVLLERHLVRGRGWMEFSVYPLFSPQSLIAEGTGNFGIEVVFPGKEREAFERDVLCPIAGIDPRGYARYSEARALVEDLSHAVNEAARRYLDRQIDGAAAARWLQELALYSPERAASQVRFIDRYRSYVINYNLGQDLVRAYVERKGGTAAHPDRRWEEFQKLLRNPILPSELLPPPESRPSP